MAVLEMVDKISDAIGLDNKYYSLRVFIDFSKAFDTLEHNILLRKLEYYGGLNHAFIIVHSFSLIMITILLSYQ